jgi:hypothetical protein
VRGPGTPPRSRPLRSDGYAQPDPAAVQARLVAMGLVAYVADGVVRSRIRVDHKRFVELEGVEIERMHELVADDERTARIDAPSPLRWVGPFSLEGVRNERELGAQLAELWARASRGLRARLAEARASLPSLALDGARGAFVATHLVEGRAVELVLDETLEHAVPSSFEGAPLPEALTIALPLDALFVERLVGLVRTRTSSLSSTPGPAEPSSTEHPRVAPLGEGTQLADEALLVEAPIEFDAGASLADVLTGAPTAPGVPTATGPSLVPAFGAPLDALGARPFESPRAASEPGRSATVRAPSSPRLVPHHGSPLGSSAASPSSALPLPPLGRAPSGPASSSATPFTATPFTTTPSPELRSSVERERSSSSDPFGRLASPVRGRAVDAVADKLGPFDDPFVDHGRSWAPISPVLALGDDAELRVDRVERLHVDLSATLGLGPTRVGVRVLNLSANGLFVSAAAGALPEVGATVALLRENIRPIRARIAHKRSLDGGTEHAGLALLSAAERALPTQFVHVLVAMPDSAMRRLASDLVVRNEMLPLPVDDLLAAVHALHVFPVSLVLLAPDFGGHDAERVVESLHLDRPPSTVLLLGGKGTQRPGLRLVDPVMLGDTLARYAARARSG